MTQNFLLAIFNVWQDFLGLDSDVEGGEARHYDLIPCHSDYAARIGREKFRTCVVHRVCNCAEKIALGSDYPFPLGESRPGSLIDSMPIPETQKQRMLGGTALEFLGLDERQFQRPRR